MSKRLSAANGELTFATTLMVHDLCVCLALQKAARTVARQYDEALRPAHLTNGQFSLLMAVNRAEAPNLVDVANLLGMDRTTLTANLKPLARRGLVKIAVDPEDRRSRRLFLSARGRSALASALPIWKKTQARMARTLKGIDPKQLRAALNALS
ncbi:MAG: MarR family winged helix-turn-helix transcriptional regulator [Methylovirgula sp.]|jgi:DNA-binding MarR family transcriptional regulator